MEKYRKIFYQCFANFIALFHVLWGLWGAVGAILALNGYYPKHPVAWAIYLVAMIANGFYLKFLRHCPLSVVERKMRQKYNPTAKILDQFSTYYLQKFTGLQTTAPIV